MAEKKASRTPRNNLSQIERKQICAIKSDIEELRLRFYGERCVSYTEFTNIFIEQGFPHIFAGRLSSSDYAEFAESVLTYAATFMFSRQLESSTEGSQPPPYVIGLHKPMKTRIIDDGYSPYLEKIFGIYLTYSLYYLRVNKAMHPIRVTSMQMRDLSDFLRNEMMKIDDCLGTLQAVWILIELTDNDAFTIVPFQNEFNILHRKFDISEAEWQTHGVEPSSIPDFPWLNNLKNDAVAREIDEIDKKYAKMKEEAGIYTNTDVGGFQKFMRDLLTRTEEEYLNGDSKKFTGRLPPYL